jgi:hypothetical protein
MAERSDRASDLASNGDAVMSVGLTGPDQTMGPAYVLTFSFFSTTGATTTTGLGVTAEEAEEAAVAPLTGVAADDEAEVASRPAPTVAPATAAPAMAAAPDPLLLLRSGVALALLRPFQVAGFADSCLPD